MKKSKPIIVTAVSLVLAALMIFALTGCASDAEKRVNEYADQIYIVFWGVGYEDEQLPSGISSSRNEIDGEFESKERKIIFITDSFTALNLSASTIESFTGLMENGYSLYYYEKSKILLDSFLANFNSISTPDGGNYLCRLRNVDGEIAASFEFDETDAAAEITKATILLTILERSTH